MKACHGARCLEPVQGKQGESTSQVAKHRPFPGEHNWTTMLAAFLLYFAMWTGGVSAVSGAFRLGTMLPGMTQAFMKRPLKRLT